MMKFLNNTNFQVKMSDNAGKYLCNFTYFHALQSNQNCLFVHVPNRVDQVKQFSQILEKCLVWKPTKQVDTIKKIFIGIGLAGISWLLIRLWRGKGINALL